MGKIRTFCHTNFRKERKITLFEYFLSKYCSLIVFEKTFCVMIKKFCISRINIYEIIDFILLCNLYLFAKTEKNIHFSYTFNRHIKFKWYLELVNAKKYTRAPSLSKTTVILDVSEIFIFTLPANEYVIQEICTSAGK